MAKYGYDFYGSSFYGGATFIDFDARPFTAVCIDYQKILLLWATPSGAWDQMRITRDNSGYSPRADMGKILVDQPASAPITNFEDTVDLTPGSFYYYTVWVKATADQTWRRAADTTGLVVKEWGNSDRLFELTPAVYRDKDADTQAAKIYGEGQLQRFLQIFGFQLDHIRSELESLKDVNNPDKVSGGLLPLMAKQWGIGFEQELGMRLSRIQSRNAVHIYRYKGTKLGVEAAVSAFTGWAPTVTIGVNLMIDQDDASFENTISRWINLTNVTLTRKAIATAPVIPAAVAAPTGPSVGNIGSGAWVLQMSSVAAGDMEARLADTGTYLPQWYGVPVAGSTAYVFSAYFRGNTAFRNVSVRIRWYTAAGVFITQTTGTDVLETSGNWVRPLATATSPANAVWAAVCLYVKATAGAAELHWVDALQFEQGTVPSTWQPARDVRIKMAPDRINYIINPGFEANVTGWTGVNTTLAQSATVAKFGTNSMRMTVTANGDISAYSDADVSQVLETTKCTFSIYVRPGSTVRNARADIQWLDSGDVVRGTSTGTVTSETAGAWVRLTVSGLKPAGAFTVVKARCRIYVLAGVAAELHYVDGALFEVTTVAGEWFSAEMFSPEGEYMWEGTVAASRTLFYSRRLIKNYRLNQRMVDFLPAGATYTLLYAA